MKNLTLFLMLVGVSQVLVADKQATDESLSVRTFLYDRFIKPREQAKERAKEQAALQKEAESLTERQTAWQKKNERLEQEKIDLITETAALVEKKCRSLPRSLTLTTRLMKNRPCKGYLVDEFGRMNEEHKKTIEQYYKNLPSCPKDTPFYENAEFIYHRPAWGFDDDEKPYHRNLISLLDSKEFINEYNQFKTSNDEKNAAAMEKMINDVRR